MNIKITIYLIFSFVLLLFLSRCGSNKAFNINPTGNFYGELFTGKKSTLPYQIYVPKGFDRHKKYPFVLFLHGAGERGLDNQKQLIHGSKKLKDKASEFGAILLIPQCPETDYWSSVDRKLIDGKYEFLFGSEIPTISMATLLELIDEFTKQSFVDKSKMSVTGLSMGGMATFEILWRRPGMFQHGAPICGGGDAQKAEIMTKTKSIKIYHGDKDDIVEIGHSKKMYDALKKVNANVDFTIYPGVGHNSWDNAFVDDAYWRFLLFK